MVVVQVSEGGGHGERDQFPSSQPRGGLSLGSCAQFFISADLRFPSPSINDFLYFGPPTTGAMLIPGSLRWHLSSQGKETVEKENRVGGVAIQKKKKSRRTSSSSDEEQRENKDTE